MKDNLAPGIYLERIKYLRHRIVNVGALLLIFIITVFLIFVKQSKKLTEYQKEHSQIQNIRDFPWSKLQSLYENSFSYLEEYTEEIASPLSAFCFNVGIDLMLLNGLELKEDDKDNPTITKTIAEITYSGKHLSKYVFDLRNIIAAQKTNTSFNELNKEKLLKIFDIYNFNKEVNLDSIEQGIRTALPTASIFLRLDSIDKRPIQKKILKNLYKTSISKLDTVFTSYETMMLLRNPHLGENFPDSLKQEFKDTIEKSFNYKNLSQLENRHSYLSDAISQIKRGESINLPWVNFTVSIKEIFIYGGIMNLGILLYFYFMTSNLRILQNRLENSRNHPLTKQEKEAIFFSLDYQINKKWIYLTLNTFFFSAVPIISIFFGYKFLGEYTNNPEKLKLFQNIIIFTILFVNFAFSIFISNKLFQLNKN